MEQGKICTICGSKLGKNGCKQCGALVCDDCYLNEKGVCSNCSGGNV